MISRKPVTVPKAKNIANINVGLIGESKVGKTSLISRLCHDTYSDQYVQTVVVGFEQYYNHQDRKLSAVEYRLI